ncbi:MAG: 3-phosphoserine/phosphohydroxythreonine transaminase [Flavobacteriales bacterium]
MSKVHNFNAGPSILPEEVIEEVSKGAKDLNGNGVSVLEISHRSKEFKQIMQEAQNLVRELLDIPDNYSVLFLQGGASLGFHMIPMNLMKAENGKAAYVETGSWAKKAIKEAKKTGEVEVIASSADSNHDHIPKDFEVPSDADYLHITSNNTIFGTQFRSFPETDIPVVCDMSSDIFSRPIDIDKFDLIYAGAQKNMGPAGTTLYVVNNDILGKTGRDIPSILDFQVHDDKDSIYNTPSVYAVYACKKVLEWIKKNGGVQGMEERNAEKAELLYDEIDRNPMFEGVAKEEDRSHMNVTFVMKDDEQKEAFEQMWQEAGIIGLPGHRSVGGYRASIYNALPKESVEALVSVMKEFSEKYSKVEQ